jgi:hypothetical protein
MDVPYQTFATEFDQTGITNPEFVDYYMSTTMSGFRTDQWAQLYKMIINAPKSMAMMILTLTDPFYFDAQNKLKSCDLRKGMHPRSFATPFRDNNKGHQIKPFTLYPPLPFIPPYMIGPMDIGVGGLYDSSLDSMASPIGPALFAAGPLMGDNPKNICNYSDGARPPSSMRFNGPVGSTRLGANECEDEE